MTASDGFNDALMLVDGHSLAFRAYFALPATLRAPDGEPIQAVYGFMGMLFRLLEDHRPRWLAVAFDEGRPFRHDLYDAYKAGREEIPDDIGAQVARLRRLLTALGVHQVAGAPFEADDYIATLARSARGARDDVDVLVVTGDRDLFQLVDQRTSVLYPRKGVRDGVRYDAEAVRARFGVDPDRLTDYKALVGDPSDNIPGVRGIGEKTAAKLIAAHGDLEGVFAALPGLAPALRDKLERGRENAVLSRALAALRFDAPAELDWAAMAWRFAPGASQGAMSQLGFSSTIGRLPAAYALGDG